MTGKINEDVDLIGLYALRKGLVIERTYFAPLSLL